MSNQFFNYVINLIIDYFEKAKINPGGRYYLQIDKEEDVISLIECLKELPTALPFQYRYSEHVEQYETIYFEINNVKLVIANTSHSVNPDFLVTLRNQVGEQQGQWQGTALFSIVSSTLDSISGGSSDLQKEGMPLHPKTFVQILKTDIEKRIESKVEQIILTERMDQILKDGLFHQVTFFEFEEIFSALSKGKIESQDYKNFGLFKDTDLHTFNATEIRKRLELNRELFEFVRKYHELGYEEELLDKKIATSYTKGVTKPEEWETLDFTDVNRAAIKAKEESKESKVELIDVKLTSKQAYLWNRPQKETSAGSRKRHIIVFNPERLETIQLVANFSFEGKVKKLEDKYVSTGKKTTGVQVNVGKVNMTIDINIESAGNAFCKVTYKHEGKVANGCELNIAVLPISPEMFADFETNYYVDSTKTAITTNLENETKTIGDGQNVDNVEVINNEHSLVVNQDTLYNLTLKSEAFNDDNEVLVTLEYKECNAAIDIIFKNEIPETTPINGFKLWRLKREEGIDFSKAISSNKLVFGNREFYATHELMTFLDWESNWVEQGMKSAKIDSGTLVSIDIEVSVTLREAYNRFINKYRIKNNIPSLCVMGETLIQSAREYVEAYIDEVNNFTEGTAAGKKGRDLFLLGVLQTQDATYLTPFHPLTVAYQIELFASLENEPVDSTILARIRPDSLLPFIYHHEDSEELYKSDSQSPALEWISYRPLKKVSVSDANKYLAKIIQEKITQFEEHFSYLFQFQVKSPIKVNVINIENDDEVVRGILKWMLNHVNKGLNAIRPIEITIYRESNFDSAFDKLSKIKNANELMETFNIDLDKNDEYDPADILRAFHQSIVYFKKSSTGDFEYAHITYYRMNSHERYAVQPMDDMSTGLSLKGLSSVVPTMRTQENYRSGFGLKNYTSNERHLLVETARTCNELAANLKNEGNDSFWKGQSIFSRTTTADESYLKSIFESSHWVTFIDSNLDLDYFNNFDDNVIIIHYNDQHSSSNKYDAITVTNKSDQYIEVIKEFLKNKEISSTTETAINTVKAFNTFNGEWLLRIIGSKGHYSREKLSIISAIKFALAYFDHPDIKWVPISLEEILRVAGGVSLSKSEGLFTPKNLGFKGAYSDDLLLMGIEERDDALIVHFYPVEVKIGVNAKPILDKAKIQIHKTKSLFKDALCNGNKPFTSKYYRYFFAQLYLVNAAKLQHSGFWQEKDFNISDTVVNKLLNNKMVISFNAEQVIGEGAVLSFQKGAHIRESELNDGVMYVNLPESDGLLGLTQSMSDIYEWLQTRNNDFVKETMLSKQYHTVRGNEADCFSSDGNQAEHNLLAIDGRQKYDVKPEEPVQEAALEDPEEPTQEAAPEDQEEPVQEAALEDPEEPTQEAAPKEPEEPVQETAPVVQDAEAEEQVPEQPKAKQDIADIRVLLGKAENSNKDIYWEYGNNDLANRHLLISGKSGQGKTYFMQCLLLELSKQSISSLIIDYTEGFLPNQLEPEFVEFLGDKLKQRVVYTEQFPINPFVRNVRTIGGITLPESDTDIAERIKSVFASVYNSLGIQQQNAIYEAVLLGMKKYDHEMSLDYLRLLLEEDGSNYAKTALSQIKPFIDRNVFSQDSLFNWTDILNDNGTVNIVQLTGYPRDVQLIITEFILWDLWNYTLKSGNKNKPVPVIMDEAQNLDHSEHSPSAKILTEGRKFGLSGWYATQALKSQLTVDELARIQNSSQKVYFAQPEQEISFIASNLSSDSAERKRLETKILNLKKGQCLIHGPILGETGQLTSPTVITVNITPLTSRM